jgi:hypothetical protein
MIYFDTHEFVLSHGREPRGRGGWAFQAREDYYKPGASGADESIFWVNDLYAAAKRAAAKHFPPETEVMVCP